MTESDELLTKADALLGRWRSGAVVPQPPADYPVLNDIVSLPATSGNLLLPEIPSEPDMPALEASAVTAETAAMEIPVLESLDAPTLEAPVAPEAAGAEVTMLEVTDDFPNLLLSKDTPAPDGAAMQALEERVRVRVLDAIEPYVGAFLDEPLRVRIEELARDLATAIARDARNDILTLVREAVRSAVARELKERSDQ